MALLGEFDGVTQQINQYLHQSVTIRQDPCGQAFVNLTLKDQSHAFDAVVKQVHGMRHGFTQLKGFGVYTQFARLELRIVQYIVDHGEQMLTRLLGELQYLHGLGISSLGGLEQVIKAHDGVHGGAQFMADGGNELVTNIRYCLQLLAFDFEFIVADFDLCNGFVAKALVNQCQRNQAAGCDEIHKKSIDLMGFVQGRVVGEYIEIGQRRHDKLQCDDDTCPNPTCSAAHHVNHQNGDEVEPVNAR